MNIPHYLSYKWEDNVKMDLRVGCVDQMHQTQDKDQWQALVNTVTNHWVPYKAGGSLIR